MMRRLSAWVNTHEGGLRVVFRIFLVTLLLVIWWRVESSILSAESAYDVASEAKSAAESADEHAISAERNAKAAARSCESLRYK